MALTALLLTAAIVLIAGAAADAQAAEARFQKVCTKTATVRDTPRGFAIARLRRGQKVTVARASATKGWSAIRTSTGLPGWMLTRSLCT